ncbi:hypothetical protein JCM18899A_54140 [Nocardioides sp. AN3]
MTFPAYALDHFSLTVPNLEQAVDFFIRALGARLKYTRVLAPGSEPALMEENYLAHREAGFALAKLELGGLGIELFEYSAPDQSRSQPRNCDLGGTHLGIVVPDIDEAIRLAATYPGVRVLGEPQTLRGDHPLGGRRWVYLLTPWGQQFEFVSDELRA